MGHDPFLDSKPTTAVSSLQTTVLVPGAVNYWTSYPPVTPTSAWSTCSMQRGDGIVRLCLVLRHSKLLLETKDRCVPPWSVQDCVTIGWTHKHTTFKYTTHTHIRDSDRILKDCNATIAKLLNAILLHYTCNTVQVLLQFNLTILFP